MKVTLRSILQGRLPYLGSCPAVTIGNLHKGNPHEATVEVVSTPGAGREAPWQPVSLLLTIYLFAESRILKIALKNWKRLKLFHSVSFSFILFHSVSFLIPFWCISQQQQRLWEVSWNYGRQLFGPNATDVEYLLVLWPDSGWWPWRLPFW